MADTLVDELAQEIATKGQYGRAPTLPSIAPPAPTVESLLASVKAIKAIVEAREGINGSVMDKAVTLRDLVETGALQLTINGHIIGGATSSVLAFVGQGLPGPKGDTGSTGAAGLPGGGFADPRPIASIDADIPFITNVHVDGSFNSVFLKWDMAEYQNHSHVEVWRKPEVTAGVSPGLTGASHIGDSTSNVYVDSGAALGTTYWYWFRAIGISAANVVLTGSYDSVGGHSGGRLKIGNVDLGPLVIEAGNLANGAVGPDQLAPHAVGLTQMATDLEPIKLVTGLLPTVKSTSTIFYNGSLYRWDGTQYTKAVANTDIIGQLTYDQIAGIQAAQITTQLTGTQITDRAISTTKIASGAVTANEIFGGTITGDKIAGNTITGGNIQGLTITGDHIVGNSIDGGKITTDSLDAGKIRSHTISAQQLAVGAVTAGSILVTGKGSALNDDPSMTDTSAWVQDPGYAVAPRQVRYVDGSTPSGQYAYQFYGAGVLRSRGFAVSAGRQYRVQCYARKFGPSLGGVFYLRLYCYDAAGGLPAYALISTLPTVPNGGSLETVALPTDGVWRRYAGVITIPAGIVAGQIVVIGNYNDNPGEYTEVQDVRCDEYVGADLIVDGSIIAGKLAANTIVAGDGVITNGAITNAMIQNLNADKINAGEMNTGVIYTGTLNASQVTTGTLGAAVAYLGVVNANQIGVGQLAAGVIYSGTIDANQITTGTLSASRIGADSITTGKILVGEVTTATSGTTSFSNNALGTGWSQYSITPLKIGNITGTGKPITIWATINASGIINTNNARVVILNLFVRNGPFTAASVQQQVQVPLTVNTSLSQGTFQISIPVILRHTPPAGSNDYYLQGTIDLYTDGLVFPAQPNSGSSLTFTAGVVILEHKV